MFCEIGTTETPLSIAETRNASPTIPRRPHSQDRGPRTSHPEPSLSGYYSPTVQVPFRATSVEQRALDESQEATSVLGAPAATSLLGNAGDTGLLDSEEQPGPPQREGQENLLPLLDNPNANALLDPTIPFIAEGFVDVDTLEYQLGSIVLDAMEVIERLAITESRNAQVWDARSANRSDQRWQLALHHTIMRASLARETQPHQQLGPSPGRPQPAYTREQVRRLGHRFSREPSSLQPAVNRVWTVRCPNIWV